MPEIHGKPEIPEMKQREAAGFQEIKPQTDMSVSEAKDFINSLFKETKEFINGIFNEAKDTSDGYYTSYKDRLDRTPADGIHGQWEGEHGESMYKPSDETDAGKAVKEKLAEKGLEGIEYKNAEPDFSKCAEATVEIDNMTEHRPDYYDAEGNKKPGNFSQADARCSEQWNASQSGVKKINIHGMRDAIPAQWI